MPASKPVKAADLEKALLKHLPKRLLLTSEALKTAKADTSGVYKSTLVTDIEKARRYLEKHDVEYVMVSRDVFLNKIT